MTSDPKNYPAFKDTAGGVPPPGCQVRGCCMGIPIGCGAFLLLLLLVSGVLTALRSPSASPVAAIAATAAPLKEPTR
jgi:hypothetical protein